MIQVCMSSINRLFKKLSIVIPVYNEEKSIAETLRAIPSKIEGVDEIIKVIIEIGTLQRKQVVQINLVNLL